MINEFKDILASKNWKKIKLIEKGWSHDKKYYIETIDGEKLLLRVSDISTFDKKMREFDRVSKLANLPFEISKAIEFGKFNDDTQAYILYKWIDGEDVSEKIQDLSEIEQYELGIQSGKIMKEIHNIEVEHKLAKWSERFNKKIDKKIKGYLDCPISFENANRVINYINKNRYLLDAREQCFQHGDYHIGNMLINEERELGIIDFNRHDIGDPWEEFNRIFFCYIEGGKYFASGRINGYFDGDVPDEFFKLLALYVGNNALAAIPWAIPYGEKDVEVMLRQAKSILEWYDNYESYIPSWYISKDEIKQVLDKMKG